MNFNAPLLAGQSTPPEIASVFDPSAVVVLMENDCLEAMATIPRGTIKLVVTSPPYNIGKEYETATRLDRYLKSLEPIIDGLVRVLSPNGSCCWQVGNYVEDGEIFPLDMYFYPLFKRHGLRLRNRVVWHFGHGLHASRRFSGRYETLLWFSRGDSYTFNLDEVRVPAKYPGKRHFKGDKRGQPSGNPLGKNPSDIWEVVAQDWETGMWDIPNVKANHPEKTIHPCQFPVELVERCVLALTNPGDWVLDPFCGVGSSLIAALRHERRGAGCDRDGGYVAEAKRRIIALYDGTLPLRPIGRPVHQPTGRERVSQVPMEWLNGAEKGS